MWEIAYSDNLIPYNSSISDWISLVNFQFSRQVFKKTVGKFVFTQISLHSHKVFYRLFFQFIHFQYIYHILLYVHFHIRSSLPYTHPALHTTSPTCGVFSCSICSFPVYLSHPFICSLPYTHPALHTIPPTCDVFSFSFFLFSSGTVSLLSFILFFLSHFFYFLQVLYLYYLLYYFESLYLALNLHSF